MTAERPGFKSSCVRASVPAAQSVRVTIALEVGQLSETVTVSGGATLIQTETRVSVIRSWDACKYLPI